MIDSDGLNNGIAKNKHRSNIYVMVYSFLLLVSLVIFSNKIDYLINTTVINVYEVLFSYMGLIVSLILLIYYISDLYKLYILETLHLEYMASIPSKKLYTGIKVVTMIKFYYPTFQKYIIYKE